MRVKGSVLLTLVKIIRSRKDKDWRQYFLPEDWEIIKSIVTPSKFYPGESFWRIANAVFKELGQASMDQVRGHGRDAGKDLLNVYRSAKVDGDPVASIKKMLEIRQSIYEYGEGLQKPEIESGLGWVTCKLVLPRLLQGSENAHLSVYTLLGTLEETAEQAGAKNVKGTATIGDKNYEIHLTWE